MIEPEIVIGSDMENFYLASVMVTEGIGNVTMKNLMEHFGSGEAIWKAAREEFESLEIRSSLVDALINFRSSHPDCPEQIAEFCEKKKIKICGMKDNNYPERLKSLKDAPILLYYKGELLTDVERIAIVGTRHPSNYGRQIAERWAENIASAGVEIVSGAAYGIDMSAHKGALKSGRTIAVLGEGIEVVQSRDKKKFLEQIAENGAVISEYSPNTFATKGTFPHRNRLIAGMSVGVVVVESDVGGGAMNTAQHAGDNGRLVFAVPGSIYSNKSRGCHELIRDGAILVKSDKDIFETCKFNFDKSTPIAKVIGLPPLEGDEEIVMKLIPMTEGISEDEILEELEDMSVPELSNILVKLEGKGYITQEGFGNYVRAYGS